MIELSCTAHYHCTQIKIIIAWCARGAHLQLRYTVAAQIYCFQFNCVLICAPFREIKKISDLWVFYLSSSLITILLKTHISNNINRVTEVFCLHTSQYYISDPSLDSESRRWQAPGAVKKEKKSKKNLKKIRKKSEKNRASAYICFCRLRAKSRF